MDTPTINRPSRALFLEGKMRLLKGHNRLVLNTATMNEIVQFYLDNKLVNRDESSPKVINFASAAHGRYADEGMFEVSLDSSEAQS
jgi:hypothetical protein